MRTIWVSLVLLLGACSRSAEVASEPSKEEQAPSGPGIAVTAAPGVAFAYAYAFSLPPTRIAAAQETHAAACERLGVARCRITGMRYQLVGENDIRGMLAFKLDPTLARAFGKSGIAAIEAADGRLVDAEITGTDAGAEIRSLEAGKAAAREELSRIDRELARTNLAARERAELQRQRADVVASIAQTNAGATEQRETLASTPMTFDYRSGNAVRGFDPSAPLKSALDTAIASAQTTLTILLGGLAIFGPPAIVLFLLWLGWRRVRHLLPRRKASTADPVA